MRFPHCDQRILHAPGAGCRYCDESGLQEVRRAWHIAFSGQEPGPGETACPADLAVLSGERGDYNEWPGNRPSS